MLLDSLRNAVGPPGPTGGQPLTGRGLRGGREPGDLPALPGVPPAAAPRAKASVFGRVAGEVEPRVASRAGQG